MTTILSIGAVAIVVALFVKPAAYTSEALDARLTHEYGGELAKAGITSIVYQRETGNPYLEIVYQSGGEDVDVNWTLYHYRAFEISVADGHVTMQGWRLDYETDSDTRDRLYATAESTIGDALRAVSAHKRRATEWASWAPSSK